MSKWVIPLRVFRFARILTRSKEGRILDIYDLEFTNLGLLALSPCCAAAYYMQTGMSSSTAGPLLYAKKVALGGKLF